MESHPDSLLKLRKGTKENVRKIFNLDKPGRLEEAINILREWIQKQDHILKKDWSADYLEKTLIASKGSVEKAKQHLDRLCTMKTLVPKFFEVTNVKDLPTILDMAMVMPLPTQTEEYYRVILVKLDTKEVKPEYFTMYFQYCFSAVEYIKAHDYANGFILIYDCRELNLVDVITKISTVELQQFITVLIEGYGARLKGIHIISESKAVEMLLNILKQFLSEKIGNRLHVQRNIEDLPKVVPKGILPVEYGGNEKSIKVLQEEWLEALSSEKHVEYVKMMYEARTDETRRNAGKFNEEYMGMPGSFRNLSVD
uniref:CRAL-TRIO domain-containing protein n=1 Tax=Heliothis virescens TaxID=7102 RepID=A0A2A4IUI0_HELVI